MDVGEGDIRSLAIYQSEVLRLNEYLNTNGMTYVVKREGRPYQCPACKGTGARKQPKGADADALPPPTTAEIARRRCTICHSAKRESIDAALHSGQSLRAIVKQFGTARSAKQRFSPATLLRHKRECLAMTETAGAATAAAGVMGSPCLFCKGKGAIPGRVTSQIIQFPEVAQRKIAADMVAKLSAQLGLDNVNLVRVRGKIARPTSNAQSRAEALRSRANALRR